MVRAAVKRLNILDEFSNSILSRGFERKQFYSFFSARFYDCRITTQSVDREPRDTLYVRTYIESREVELVRLRAHTEAKRKENEWKWANPETRELPREQKRSRWKEREKETREKGIEAIDRENPGKWPSEVRRIGQQRARNDFDEAVNTEVDRLYRFELSPGW